MAVGFPAKTTFANGNVLPASDLNDLAGTLNSLTNGTYTGNVTTNASTATALKTARNINTVSFDGTANIVTHVGGQGTTNLSGVFTVTHGLGQTPSAVVATQRTAGTTTGSPRIFYVSRISATQFDIYALDTAGAQVAGPFYWIAVA
jgi:hypothetical protein